jgi:hypothetical protein
MFKSVMKFKSHANFENFYTSVDTDLQCYIEYVHTVGWVASYDDADGGDEEYFTAPSDCARWLESKVAFKMPYS